MKKLLIKLALVLAMITSTAVAKDNRHINNNEMTVGMKVFKKKMRKGCRSTAIRFSRSHTQHQWKIIKKNGLLPREAKVLCPHLDTSILTNNDWNNVYTFLNDHSSDNPVILKC